MNANKVIKVDEDAKSIIGRVRDELTEQEGHKFTFSETVKRICSIQRTKYHKNEESEDDE